VPGKNEGGEQGPLATKRGERGETQRACKKGANFFWPKKKKRGGKKHPAFEEPEQNIRGKSFSEKG